MKEREGEKGINCFNGSNGTKKGSGWMVLEGWVEMMARSNKGQTERQTDRQTRDRTESVRQEVERDEMCEREDDGVV